MRIYILSSIYDKSGLVGISKLSLQSTPYMAQM